VLTLRGISSRDTTEIGDPAISVSVDGTYSNRPYALTSTLYDLERVEVLRGPQGTLYGRNATGGALNIVTAAPTKVFGGYGSFEIGNYRTHNVEGALNVPLSDTVQMRAAVSQRAHDGYLNNGAAQNGNDEDSRSARLSLAFQPSTAFSGLVTVETTAIRGIGQQPLMLPFQTDANGNVVHTGIALPDDPRSFPLRSPAYLDMNQDLVRWKFSYALPLVDLSYIGGYAKIDFHHADMQSSSTTLQSFVQNEYPKTWNHELRVSGKPGGALDWQAGYYHFNEDSSLFSYNAVPGDGDLVNRLFSFEYATKAKSDAVFGQASYKMLENLRLSAGLRYTKDEKSRDGNILINNSDTPPITYFAVPSNASGSWNKTNYHLGVDWDLQKDLMLYAKYDTAYKAGGFTDIAPYGPENVRGVEVGSKGRFLNQRLQVNSVLLRLRRPAGQPERDARRRQHRHADPECGQDEDLRRRGRTGGTGRRRRSLQRVAAVPERALQGLRRRQRQHQCATRRQPAGAEPNLDRRPGLGEDLGPGSRVRRLAHRCEGPVVAALHVLELRHRLPEGLCLEQRLAGV
jgi:iron complex outermembrane receptor protein